jgi:hypothetical protein
MKKLCAVLLGSIALCLVFACENDDEHEGEDSSHNTGKNCLGCHSNFKLAGSVYNSGLSSPLSGVQIKVTTEPDGAGTVLATLTSDGKGNFYTSGSLNFGTGVYVSAEGSSGTVKYMDDAITSGACNSCHGTSTSKVWAE